MAAPDAAKALTAEVIADDDDAWLYGDEGKGETDGAGGNQDKPQSGRKGDGAALANGMPVKKEDREEGEMSGEEGESQEKEDDDDSDDDNVQVTIGDIKAWSVSEQPRNLFKSGTNYQKPGAGPGGKPVGTTKGIDIEAQGTINGVPVYEFDLNSIENEEKPWRKPGADITDYFNYGFTEETWQQYCDKQRRLIAMNDGIPKIVSNHTIASSSNRAEKDLGVVRNRAQPVSKPQGGTIDVIGGTAKDSRRPDEGDPIPVAGVVTHVNTSDMGSQQKPKGFTPIQRRGRKFMPVPGLPPTSIPPPHIPPVDYSIPPPGLPPPHGVPPPGMGIPPPGFPPVPDPFDPFYGVPPPDRVWNRSMPPPGFEDRPPFSYGPTHPTFSSTFSEASRGSGPQQWETGSAVSEQDSRDRERDWDRDRERRESSRRDRERSPHRSEEDFGRDAKYRGHERERDRERERERERGDRERGDRDRKRERERRRSRSLDRERELESSRREREEEKHRSRRSDSRRHKGEDSDTESRSSSKHKKSRRRREKDDDMSESLAGDETPTKAE